MQIAVGVGDGGRVEFVDAVAPDGAALATVDPLDVPATFRRLEAAHGPRWVWVEARQWYPALLASGVRLARCHDLRLAGAILGHSTFTAEVRARGEAPAPAWLPPGPTVADVPIPVAANTGREALFDLDAFDAAEPASSTAAISSMRAGLRPDTG